MRISMFYLEWSIQNSSGEIIDSGSLLANDRDGNEYEKTYQVPAGNYTVTYTAKGWVPCNEQGMPGYYCACKNESSEIMGGDRETLTFTVNKDGVNVPFRLPACGHAGCKSYPCKGGSAGFQPVDPDTGLVEPTLP